MIDVCIHKYSDSNHGKRDVHEKKRIHNLFEI